jgi:hypothetical protein
LESCVLISDSMILLASLPSEKAGTPDVQRFGKSYQRR